MAQEQHELTSLHPVPGVLGLVLLHTYVLRKQAEKQNKTKTPNKQKSLRKRDRKTATVGTFQLSRIGVSSSKWLSLDTAALIDIQWDFVLWLFWCFSSFHWLIIK